MGDDEVRIGKNVLLDDLLAADLLGLLEEDVGDRRRVGRGVVAAAARRASSARKSFAPPPPAPTVESVMPAAPMRASRSSYSPLLDQPSVNSTMWRRVAVVCSSDATASDSPAKMLVWPSGVDAGDLLLDVADVAQRRGADDPVGVLVEGDDAELVALGQRGHGAQDRFLADVDLGHAADLRRRCRGWRCCSGRRPSSPTGR